MLTLNISQKKTSGLQQLIDQLESYIQTITPANPDYSAFVKELDKLYTMKKGNSRPRVDPNVLIQAGVSLLAVVAILQHERLHIIATKALSFVKFR